jgi:hypothetical protein
LNVFLDGNGLDALAVSMASGDARLSRRAVFCLRHLVATQPRVCSALTSTSQMYAFPWILAQFQRAVVSVCAISRVLERVAAMCTGEDDDARENAWHVFHEYLTCAAPTAPVASNSGGPSIHGSDAAAMMIVPASHFVPPFYERFAVVANPTICLPQVCCVDRGCRPWVPVCVYLEFRFWWLVVPGQIVDSRLESLSSLSPDDKERLSSEHSVLLELKAMLTPT